MDKWFSITCCVLFICFTTMVVNACHENHIEAMKCADQGKVWNNNRCWTYDDMKK